MTGLGQSNVGQSLTAGKSVVVEFLYLSCHLRFVLTVRNMAEQRTAQGINREEEIQIETVNLHHLPTKIKKHESSRSHINACTQLALLGEVNILTQLNSAYRTHVLEYNEQVRNCLLYTSRCV